jgi:hypothetical protein
MANELSPKDIVTFEELTLSNVWELEALIAVLERKGIITKAEILDMIQELRHKHPSAVAPHQDSILSEQKRDLLITHVVNVFNSTALTAQQALEVLEHLQVLVEIGERVANKTTH